MELTKEVLKYIRNREGVDTPETRYLSARRDGKDTTRYDMAKKQAESEPVSVERIIQLTNGFLKMCGMSPVPNPIICNPEDKLKDSKGFYNQIKTDHNLNERQDIVWMKFTGDGFLGVVAVSSDINFKMPSSRTDYTNRWYNNAGILVHRLGKTWDKRFVLVFPLCKIPNGYKRGDIECGIGNYLVDMGVPILDYYSHRF